MSKHSAIFQIILCSALWSIAGIFMKFLPWSGFVIASIRSFLAGGVVVVYMLVKKLRFTPTRHSLLGSVGLGGTMLLFSIANKTTTAANAIVLQFTCPVWIMLISALLFHKRFRKMDVVTVLVTFFGIALFFADSLSAGNMVGNLVALAAGVFFAFYYISLGECTEDERMTTVCIGHAITCLCGMPFVFTTHPVFTPQTVLFIVILGIVQLGIPYVLLAHASSACPPFICSLLGALEPLLNPLWVAIFDGEMPGILALVGGVIVIAAVTTCCVIDAKKENQPA